MFFPGMDHAIAPKYLPFDLDCADLLKRTVVATRKINKAWSRKEWAMEFARLRREVEDDSKRVDRVVRWYAAHATEKGLPSVLSAKQFRKCFSWIEDKMEKAEGIIVSITPEAQDIAKRISNRYWPKNSKQQLPAVVQIGLDAYKHFRVKLKKLLNQLVAESTENVDHDQETDIELRERLRRQRFQMFVDHVWKKCSGDSHYIEQWMLRVNQRVAEWEDWSGDLMPFAFHTKAKEFTQVGRGMAEEYYGDPSRWDKLMERLGDED